MTLPETQEVGFGSSEKVWSGSWCELLCAAKSANGQPSRNVAKKCAWPAASVHCLTEDMTADLPDDWKDRKVQ